MVSSRKHKNGRSSRRRDATPTSALEAQIRHAERNGFEDVLLDATYAKRLLSYLVGLHEECRAARHELQRFGIESSSLPPTDRSTGVAGFRLRQEPSRVYSDEVFTNIEGPKGVAVSRVLTDAMEEAIRLLSA